MSSQREHAEAPSASEELAVSSEAVPLAHKPAESAITEGNLAELPLFDLSTQSKPKSLEKLQKHFELTPRESAGGVVKRSVTITANHAYGFPTMFAYRVLLAIIDEGRRQGVLDHAEHPQQANVVVSPKIIISRYRLEQLLQTGHSAATYRRIEHALGALQSISIEMRGSWHDKRAGRSREALHVPGIISSYSFEKTVQRPSRATRTKKSPEKLPAQVEERGYVILGHELFQSLRNGYFNGVDLAYVNALADSPLAARLYIYLTKKDGNADSSGRVQARLNRAFSQHRRWDYVENLAGLAQKLGLRKMKAHLLIRSFEPALRRLSSPLAPPGSTRKFKFISASELSGDPLSLKVCFHKNEAD